MRPFFQLLYLNLLAINIVDWRYIIQCLPLMTFTKPWKKAELSIYYRLLPVNIHYKDGKRHVYTVPVKLCCPQNYLQKNHFAMASITFARELANLFGKIMCFSCPKEDDKLVYFWVYQFSRSKHPFWCIWNTKLCYLTVNSWQEKNINLFLLFILPA